MFETSGTVDEFMLAEIYKAFMPKWYTLMQIIPVAILFGLAASATMRSQYVPAGIYLIIAVIFFRYMRSRTSREACRDLKLMQKASGQVEIFYRTVLNDDGIETGIPNSEVRTAMPYTSVVQLVETRELYVVLSRERESLYIFKNRLSPDDRKALLDYLRAKCPSLSM